MELKCVVCGKECERCYDFTGHVCPDCFRKVGSKVCCICGKEVNSTAKEYWDIGLTERNGVVDTFHGLLCEECASQMVQCKVCGCFVQPEKAEDYVEIGTGKRTGEKICWECYVDDFVECSRCGGLIPRSIENVMWDEEGRVVCLICAEKLAKGR
jgi:hypothetical protein